MGRPVRPFLPMCLSLCRSADAMVSPVRSSFGNSSYKHHLGSLLPDHHGRACDARHLVGHAIRQAAVGPGTAGKPNCSTDVDPGDAAGLSQCRPATGERRSFPGLATWRIEHAPGDFLFRGRSNDQSSALPCRFISQRYGTSLSSSTFSDVSFSTAGIPGMLDWLSESGRQPHLTPGKL